MAQKTVCDVCGADIVEADLRPVEIRSKRLYLSAQMSRGYNAPHMDICASCLHSAAKVHDKSPQPEPGPFLGKLRYFVTLNGIRCPGPHAAFHCQSDVDAYLAGKPQGGSVEERA